VTEYRNGISGAYIPTKKTRLALIRPVAYIFVTGLTNWSFGPRGGSNMKVWSKPAVREQEVGLEVTSYMPAEIDII
jgi:coenzyme PQQ precursor peptide PqqA